MDTNSSIDRCIPLFRVVFISGMGTCYLHNFNLNKIVEKTCAKPNCKITYITKNIYQIQKPTNL